VNAVSLTVSGDFCNRSQMNGEHEIPKEGKTDKVVWQSKKTNKHVLRIN
jgi:hypothetical protein